MMHRRSTGRTTRRRPPDDANAGESPTHGGVTASGWYTPFRHEQSLSRSEQERRARIEHVLTFLLPEHSALLQMRHFERMTLEAMGVELGCSHVNVIKRLRVAEQDFRKAYGQHYSDDLDAA